MDIGLSQAHQCPPIFSETYAYLRIWNKKVEVEVTFCGEEAPRIFLREVLLILQSRWHFLHSACSQLTLGLDLPKWCGCHVSMPKVCKYLPIRITGLSFPSQWTDSSLIVSFINDLYSLLLRIGAIQPSCTGELLRTKTIPRICNRSLGRSTNCQNLHRNPSNLNFEGQQNLRRHTLTLQLSSEKPRFENPIS